MVKRHHDKVKKQVRFLYGLLMLKNYVKERNNKNANNVHLIYHWYNDKNLDNPCKDLSNPVILAIATVRANNKNIPISVIDVSDFGRDWGNYPSSLNFIVVKNIQF